MCTNYRPGARDLLKAHFAVADAAWPTPWPDETWPTYAGPVLLGPHATPETGRFGLVPHWAKEADFGRRTYNARSETVAEKPSFRDAWRRSQRCLIPALWFCEPNWESGKARRWKIYDDGGEPLALAGLWSRWQQPDGTPLLSYTMLTVNADGHPLMQRFHKPGEEKRSVVVLRGAERQAWLEGSEPQARALLVTPTGLAAEPDGAPTPAANPQASLLPDLLG
jgi:putative SOS response-associated peptidase YedK